MQGNDISSKGDGKVPRNRCLVFWLQIRGVYWLISTGRRTHYNIGKRCISTCVGWAGLGRELTIVLSINRTAHSSLIWVGAEEKGGVLFGTFRVFFNDFF